MVRNLAIFIDADNLNDPTALDHVLTSLKTLADRVTYRRAYGRPESLKGIEAVLWRHGVRPVANLIVDKVTTDSALVIDAVEAVCTSELDAVAICSGDADFVPLALWLRERGKHVMCYSLANKLFANPDSFYDEVVTLDVVEHVVSDPLNSADSGSSTGNGLTALPQPSNRTDVVTAQKAHVQAQASPSAKKVTVKSILAAAPELRSGDAHHLSVVTKKLRDAGLVAKNKSSTALFRLYPAQFALEPAAQPNQVRYRA